jgi:glycerate dehydrogenase
MHIVIPDCHTMNPGDLSWTPLEELGDCTFHDRTPPDRVVERCAPADALLINKVRLPAEVLEQLPNLAYVGVTATGYDVVDVAAARRHGVTVTNVPAYSTPGVAQMVFAHILNLALRVDDHARGVADGKWTRSPDFAYWDHPLVELAGLTLGIVGFGRIGQATARVGLAFGMNVRAYNPRPEKIAQVPDVEPADLDTLLRESDVVSLHCPLNDETARMINAERLAVMKPSAWLINTARGGLIDEAALADALRAGRIAGAGLDVLSTEPPAPDNPLPGAPNCFITPHIAWATRAARQRLLDVVVDNLRAFQQGRPKNVVSG